MYVQCHLMQLYIKNIFNKILYLVSVKKKKNCYSFFFMISSEPRNHWMVQRKKKEIEQDNKQQ